ncbi:hypothetical protein [Rugosimonospora africana]|uniref:S1 motif domain-containing protein n=1 Tax=Rugosimonospora africana TaxID=556532 RepID=A0A8J3QZE4_9ACTN|nr:hypothetical protein [Rugosimonospora africana]GIH20104.1 hypothetical protein Raf01_82760 [Rugosimonospora africana]
MSTWDEFVAGHAVGDVVTARVEKVVPFGALLTVDAGFPGLLPGAGALEVGTHVPVRIAEFDADAQRMRFATA